MNFNERLLQGYDLGKKTTSLHGHTQLDLLRDGKVVHRIEKDNTITGWVGDALSAGNFFNQIATDKIYPLNQWFSGCFLTDSANDATTSMLAGNTNIVAQAGDDAYSGSYTKRGSFNSVESGSGVNSGNCYIRNVWDWATSQGNGTISSICLTRGELGKVAIDPTTVYDDCATVFENAYSTIDETIPVTSDLQSCTILDYENEKGFDITYDSGTITIDEYYVSTRRIHLIGNSVDVIEKTATHTITQTLSKFNRQRASCSYDGDYIYLFTWNSRGSEIDECAINLSDWTATLTSHNYNGLSLIDELNVYMWIRDAFPMVEESGTRYLYAFTSDAKCMKLNLSSASITEVSIPVGVNKWFAGCPTCFLKNGDWIKMNVSDGKKALYYHNGSFYTTKTIPSSDTNFRYLIDTGYGTAIYGGINSYIKLFFPFVYVSTVNNITAVTKEASMTMKLTYTITETSGS